jgi:formylglycine-generating enzyme required for sulfatase activity
LPPNFEIRLPSEAEWEAACYNSATEIPTYPWGNEEPTPDLAIYDQCNLNEPAPVGICPRGATACGALDMGGNVWEWTTTKSIMYPHRSNEVRRDFQGFEHVAIRGGSFQDKADLLGARNRHLLKPEGDFYRGFRIVLAPRQRPDT